MIAVYVLIIVAIITYYATMSIRTSKDMGEISDGYHTFNELYEFRKVYNAAFFNELAKQGKCNVIKSKRHNDGEECFGGDWFIVMAQLPTGQISNHYEMKDWDLFKCATAEIAPKWDGHTPQDVVERITKYINMKDYETNRGTEAEKSITTLIIRLKKNFMIYLLRTE